MAADPIREALYAHLSGDETLAGLATGVYHLRAPESAQAPYAIFYKQSGQSIWSMRDSSSNDLWLVKGVCRGGDQEEAEAIDARCEALLNLADFEITGYALLGIRRSTAVIYPEDDDGETIFHVGALYRLQAQAPPEP